MYYSGRNSNLVSLPTPETSSYSRRYFISSTRSPIYTWCRPLGSDPITKEVPFTFSCTYGLTKKQKKKLDSFYHRSETLLGLLGCKYFTEFGRPEHKPYLSDLDSFSFHLKEKPQNFREESNTETQRTFRTSLKV